MTPEMTPEMYDAIELRLARGWEWRIVAKVVNRRMGTSYPAREMKGMYQRERRRREEARLSEKLRWLEVYMGIS